MNVCMYVCIYIHLWSFFDIHIYIHIISLLPSCPTKKTWTIDTCPMTMSHVDMCARAKTHKDQIQTVFFLAMKCDHLSDPWGAVTPDGTGTIATFPSCDFVELLHSADLRPKLEKTDMEENRGLSTYSRTDLHIPTCHKSLHSNLELPTCSCCSI